MMPLFGVATALHPVNANGGLKTEFHTGAAAGARWLRAVLVFASPRPPTAPFFLFLPPRRRCSKWPQRAERTAAPATAL